MVLRILFPFLFGTGTVVPMLEAVMAVVPAEKLAVHFHDTYGQSLPNILVSLQVSLRTNTAKPYIQIIIITISSFTV